MRRWVIVAVVAVVAVVALAGIGAGAWWLLRSKARPEPVAAAYLEAWGRGDWAAMQAQVATPPADFAERHTAMTEALRVTQASFVPGPATVTGDRAEVPFQARLRLRALGEWPYEGVLRLVRRDDRWRVDWSPATLHPELTGDLRFQRTRTWPERAPILAADGSELAGPGAVVTISIVGERVKDPAAVADALVEHVEVAREAARRALADAERRPNQAVPVATLPEVDYQAVRDDIYPVPGLSFEAGVGREYDGPASARMLLGSVGPVTADDLKELGAPYQTGDQVGHGNGLEAVFERQLAGTPSGEVRLAGGDGKAVKVLHTFAGKDGQPVETTLDPLAQRAAESALDPVGKPAALVAVRPSSGELVAVVNTPVNGYNRALLGRYPPGSTFKVVTTEALLAGGLRPGDQVGFGLAPSPGIPAVTSRVPTPSDKADLAAESFGQGRVTASPLQMALVAATVADGRWRQPTLVTGEARASGGSADPAQPGGSDGATSNDSGGVEPAKSPEPLDAGVAKT